MLALAVVVGVGKCLNLLSPPRVPLGDIAEEELFCFFRAQKDYNRSFENSSSRKERYTNSGVPQQSAHSTRLFSGPQARDTVRVHGYSKESLDLVSCGSLSQWSSRFEVVFAIVKP